MELTRRQLLFSLAALAASCRRSPPQARGGGSAPWRELSFDPGEGATEGQRALVLEPPGAREKPLLVALHGRGESGRGLEAGARGWRDDYDLGRLDDRLCAPPLGAADLQGFAQPARLERINASLAAAPYEGLCVACPYTPDLDDRSIEGAQPFGRFVVDRLLPRARAEVGGRPDRRATGIDGVSMGGRLALLVGLSHPEAFGAVGALQPAIRAEEAPLLSALAARALARAPLALRIVSSEGDVFLPACRALSERLRSDGIAHDLGVGPGPHDYGCNRGPGSAEMLLWHERVLRGLPAP